MTKSDLTLKKGFPIVEKVFELEPLQIELAPQYALLENLYSRLVLNSPEKGEPEAAIAKRYYWQDGNLYLEIRDDLKTVDGYKITADDAAFSIKRYLVKKGGTHSDLAELICGDKELQTVEDQCPGIDVQGNTLILRPAKDNAFFLLPMLTEMDFAVIPKQSVDPRTLKIIDYRNTSGPYYVEKNELGGPILLANSGHFLFNEGMPERIALIKTDSKDRKAIDLFRRGEIDFITAADDVRPDEVITLASQESANLHQTMSIRTFVLVFTNKGIKKYSESQRLAIGKTLRQILNEHFTSRPGYEPKEQFFPSFGDGSLSKQDLGILKDQFEEVHPAESGKGLTLAFVRFGEYESVTKKIATALPGIRIREERSLPAFLKYESEEDMPDCFINGPDTAFKEDIGLISYSLAGGYLSLRGSEADAWRQEYMRHPDKEVRLEKLRKLHKDTLMGGYMVPLFSAPYVSLIRKPWKINFTQLYASNHLWLLHRE